MEGFILLIKNFYISIINLFDSISFTIFGATVSYIDIIAGCLILGFAFSFLYRVLKLDSVKSN